VRFLRVSYKSRHFGSIETIGEYSHTAVTVKTFTSASFFLLLVPTMRVADYIATLYDPCIGNIKESGGLFDRIIGRSDECNWLNSPLQKLNHESCYLSICIGLLIFNHIMLRTLYDLTLCTVMCSIMNVIFSFLHSIIPCLRVTHFARKIVHSRSRLQSSRTFDSDCFAQLWTRTYSVPRTNVKGFSSLATMIVCYPIPIFCLISPNFCHNL
jgi:hypothetical protein